MAELQAACRLQWEDAAPIQASTRLQWEDAADIQSIGSPYTRPTPPAGGGGGTIGSLAPRVNVPEQLSYGVTHSLSVVDTRTTPATALPVREVTMELSDGSDLWTLQANGDGSLYSALTAGDQPPIVRVTLNGASWSFVVESIDAPQAFASSSVSFGGRSLAALADAPYQAPQQWITDAPTTAAQLVTIAQTFTWLDVKWQLTDWSIPAGAWSFSGSPLDVVRQVATAAGAVIEADRDAAGVTVRSRYPVLPNAWATTPPDWQIHWNAIERSTYQRADTPEYNAVLVAGQQQGGLLNARYAGTSGAIQGPMVTDPLLTDLPGLIERATAVLAASGKQARVSRTMQVGLQGVVPRGSLVRFVDPDSTWTGMVRSVSVSASFGAARQTIGVERRTAFQAGLAIVPPAPSANDPFFGSVMVLLPFDGDAIDVKGNTFTASTGTSFGAGKFGSALAVGGTSPGGGGPSGVTSTASMAVDFMSIPAFTAEAWVYLNSSPETAYAPIIRISAAGSTRLTLGVLGTDKLLYVHLDTDHASEAVCPIGQWFHAAVTRSAAGYKLFLNGNLVLALTSNATVADPANCVIQIGTVGGFAVDGSIDDVRITAVARYLESFTPPTRAHPRQ